MDRTSYSRWLSVHIKDLVEIPHHHEDVYQEFLKGNFVVQKTNRKFSSMGLDQAHEQNNNIIKSTSNGIQTDLTTLMTFVGPEIAMLLDQYESSDVSVMPHHEDSNAHECTFSKDVYLLQKRIAECCNPFSTEVETLIRLKSGAELDDADACASSVRTLEIRGQTLYNEFVNNRLTNCKESLKKPIPMQKVLLPGRCAVTEKLVYLTPKEDSRLLHNLSSVLVARKEASLNALQYEVQNTPLSFISNGKLNIGKKSRIMDAIKHKTNVEVVVPPVRECLLIDMSHLVMSKAFTKSTFRDLFNSIWRCLLSEIPLYKRIDVICDNYSQVNELKWCTTVSRGIDGTRVPSISLDMPVPASFYDDYMRNSDNKLILYRQLINYLYTLSLSYSDTLIIFSIENNLYCNSFCEVEHLKVSHIEGDTRIVFHLIDALKSYCNIVIRSNDTDVIILITSFYNFFVSLNSDFNIHVYTGNIFYSIHNIVKYITPQRTQGLSLLYALCGCDFTCSLFGKGPSKFLDLYLADNHIYKIFQDVIINPERFSELFPDIECFILKLYNVRDATCGCTKARYDLLLHRRIRSLRELPPSTGALLSHARRAVYIAAYYWGKSYAANPDIPPPSEWGWYRDNERLKMVLTEMPFSESPYPPLFKACKCKASTSSCSNCSCSAKEQPCYQLCACRRCCLN